MDSVSQTTRINNSLKTPTPTEHPRQNNKSLRAWEAQDTTKPYLVCDKNMPQAT